MIYSNVPQNADKISYANKKGSKFTVILSKYFGQAALILLFYCAGFNAYAQEHNKHERIKALKVSFITEKLELSATEAEKFWPIYNTYDSQIHDLRHEEKTAV